MEKKIVQLLQENSYLLDVGKFDTGVKVVDKEKASKAIKEYLQANPSEFAFVKKEQADKLADALHQIANSPIPYNSLEMQSWIETARSIAQQTLTEYEKSK